MKHLTKATLNTIDTELMKALEVVGKKLGGEFTIEGGSYDLTQYKPKLVFNVGSKEERNKSEWNQYCEMYNLEPSDYGKVITHNGDKLTITGLKTSSRKTPIRIRTSKGDYLYAADVIVELLKKQK